MKKFTNWIIYNRWFSKWTSHNYCRSLILLNEYLEKISFWKRGIKTPEKITLKDIDMFIKIERAKEKSVATCNNYLAGIKLWLKYNMVIWKEVIDYRRVLTAKEPAKKIDALTEEETKKLIDYFRAVPCETHREEVIKTRNFLICWMLVYTGLRVNELSNLKIEDIKEELQIIWKWWIRRVVYLFKEDLDIIDLYLFLRKDKSPYLFTSYSWNSYGKKLSNVSIENIIKEWWKKAWIETNIFPHKLRHTFATNLLRNWAKLPYIQQLLWHSNIQTTQTYLSVLNTDLRESQKLMKRF